MSRDLLPLPLNYVSDGEVVAEFLRKHDGTDEPDVDMLTQCQNLGMEGWTSCIIASLSFL